METKHIFSRVPVEEIDFILSSIEKEIAMNSDKFESLGLARGLLGLSLFYRALASNFENKNFTKKAFNYLEKVFEKINDDYVSATLYRELCDIANYLLYELQHGWTDENPDEILNDFDEVLSQILEDEMNAQNFDPVTGALRYGYYFLKRSATKTFARAQVYQLIDFILDIKQEDESGVYWISKLKSEDQIYFGLCHGNGGVVQFLTKVLDSGLFYREAQIKVTINKACNYILNASRPNEALIFPVIKGKVYTSIIPKSYCYGDLSTLYTLLYAFTFAEDTASIQKTISLIELAHQKGYAPPYLNGGSGLLYGIAGNAMMFRKLQQLQPRNFLKEAYQEHIETVVSHFNSKNKFLGFQAHWNKEEPTTYYCFYEGMIGIGMELLAYKNPNSCINHEEFFHLHEL